MTCLLCPGLAEDRARLHARIKVLEAEIVELTAANTALRVPAQRTAAPFLSRAEYADDVKNGVA